MAFSRSSAAQANPSISLTTGAKTVTVVNQCAQQIWLAENGNSDVLPSPGWALAPQCTPGSQSVCAAGQSCDKATRSCTCSSNSDCTFGSTSTQTATCDMTTGLCERSADLVIPSNWSGRFWPRTGCSGGSTSFSCQTGQCGPPSGGNIDCNVQGASANQATLFEITGGGTAATPTLDNYDVSLVSGFNIPIKVTPDIPIDTPTWHADTNYNTGSNQSVITQKANGQIFLFNDIGDTPGESGQTQPKFPSTRFATVNDGDAKWSNSGPTCASEGCTSNLLNNCPSGLQILGPDNKTVIACDAPANLAGASAANLSYYQCKNNQGATDLFGNPAVFQSPNAGSPICFSNLDCQPGTSCLINPTFTNPPTPAWPTGMGVCNPVIQANGCTANGDPCAAYPFVDYSCNTITTGGGNSLVCLPPTTAGAGELVANANDWSATATSCSTTNACTGSQQQCFDTTNPVYGNELKACTGSSGSCACYSPNPCQSSRGANDGCTQPNSCLDMNGVADGMNDPAIPGTVTCGSNETCYCSPQAIYSGTCGPLNSTWAAASTTPLGSANGFERDFKKACPSAYSYQFDDVASDFTCTNTVANQVNYKVTLCPSVPLKLQLIVTPRLLNFGLIAPSKLSKSKTVTVSNPKGGSAVKIDGVGPVTNFLVTNNCPAKLDPGHSCTLGVVFAPGAGGGIYREPLLLHDNADGAPQSVNLRGISGFPG